VPPGSSLVEIDLIDRCGGTLLRMTNSGLPSAEQCAGHDRGWTHYLGRLAIAATAGTLVSIMAPRRAIRNLI
jgi:activator of Hsp90 ATPase-like protein